MIWRWLIKFVYYTLEAMWKNLIVIEERFTDQMEYWCNKNGWTDRKTRVSMFGFGSNMGHLCFEFTIMKFFGQKDNFCTVKKYSIVNFFYNDSGFTTFLPFLLSLSYMRRVMIRVKIPPIGFSIFFDEFESQDDENHIFDHRISREQSYVKKYSIWMSEVGQTGQTKLIRHSVTLKTNSSNHDIFRAVRSDDLEFELWTSAMLK